MMRTVEEEKKILANDNKNNQHIRIRLQGIDAPELHYRASKGNVFLYEDQFSRFKSLNELFEFRQHYGARAAKELVILLNTYSMSDNNQKYVNAYAFSSIDQPSELFDRYGRTVSDIVIYKDNEENGINLNQWLVQEGWAFPDFYDSMSNDEISILMEKSKEAVDAQKGIRPHYSKELVDFDFNLVFEKENDDSIIANDSGLLNLPKFFRKQVDWQIIKKSGNSIKTLKKYISLRKDACYLLKDFLGKRHCAPKHELSEFVDEDGSMNVDPGSLVNIESDSQIETPNIITSWY